MSEVNVWRPVPGYNGKYEASWAGEIRRTYRKAKPKTMAQYERHERKGSRRLYVKLTHDNNAGKGKDIQVAQIIYRTFIGEIPDGHIVIHKNGLFTDNSLPNLEAVTKRECGKKTGASSSRKPVVMLGADGEAIEFYSSAREAARQNYMSYQTVIDRCNGKAKRSFSGIDFAWEDSEVSVKHARKRLGIEDGDE